MVEQHEKIVGWREAFFRHVGSTVTAAVIADDMKFSTKLIPDAVPGDGVHQSIVQEDDRRAGAARFVVHLLAVDFDVFSAGQGGDQKSEGRKEYLEAHTQFIATIPWLRSGVRRRTEQSTE